VSEAFAEDPVRILRVARFAAAFGFRVADETMALMRQMVSSGEADYLCRARVAGVRARPRRAASEKMFEVLEACGLADKLLDA
jgi:tRNA nucleotidyltransferase (CCA-adding enzyme)